MEGLQEMRLRVLVATEDEDELVGRLTFQQPLAKAVLNGSCVVQVRVKVDLEHPFGGSDLTDVVHQVGKQTIFDFFIEFV